MSTKQADHTSEPETPDPQAPNESTVSSPRLLVMSPVDGLPTITWPGPPGQPAWAVPVTIPDGTQGYAIFLPLAPSAQETPPAPATPPKPAPQLGPVASSAEKPSSARAPGDDGAPTSTGPADGQSLVDVRESAPGAGGGAPGAAPAPAPAAPASTRPGAAPAHDPLLAFLRRVWPGPSTATTTAVPTAVLVAALGIASFVPLIRTGVGWVLGWTVLTVAVIAAVRRAAATLPRAERWIRAGWAAAALVLLAVLAVRNAWWLVTLCVLGALGCTALAIAGGRAIRSMLVSLVAVPIAAVRGLPWLRRHIASRGRPGKAWRILGSLAATLLVLVIFGRLLSSADAAFATVLGTLVPSVGTTVRWIVLFVAGGLLAVGAIYTLSAPPDVSVIDRPSRRRLGLLAWAAPVGALTLLFAGFVVVQFTVLFGGREHVLATAGLTYAQYARSGFWQLLLVTVLTLGIVAGVSRWARRERRVERVLLRALLGTLCALSTVIVASALSRMLTYQQAYGFTGARLFVMALELFFGAVFLTVMAAGIRLRGEWVPRVVVALAVAMLAGLAVLNPDAYAARRNIDRFQETGKIDIGYLRSLSADAVPALAELPDSHRRCALGQIAADLTEPDPWYAWNLGRARARAVLEELRLAPAGLFEDCHAVRQVDSRTMGR